MGEPSTPINTAAVQNRRRFVLLLTLGLLVLFLYTISDLLPATAGGIVLWTMTAGLFNKIQQKVRKRGVAAALTMFSSLLLIIVPLAVIVLLTAADAAKLAQKAQSWFEPYRPQISATIESISRRKSFDLFGYTITVDHITQGIEGASSKIGQFLLNLLKRMAGGVAYTLLMLGVLLYTLFFFYLDGDRFLEWLKKLLPLDAEQSSRLLADFFATSRSTLKTVVVLGALQGTLGGLAFWVCGVPAPFFWGVIIAVASVIPAVGTQIICVPAAVLLILIGDTWYGIGLLIWSLVVVSSADNLLRPILVKHDVQLHELLVFLSTVGGIAAFGVFGVLIGPVIASLLKVSLQMYWQIYQKETMQ